MKIDKTPPLPRTNAGETSRAPVRTDSSNAGAATPSAEVITHITTATTDASQDIDSARIEEIKAAIREGRLNIDAEKIADKLIVSVQDLLSNDLP